MASQISVLFTQYQYQSALDRVRDLIQAGSLSESESDEFEVLVTQITEYEDKHFPIQKITDEQPQGLSVDAALSL